MSDNIEYEEMNEDEQHEHDAMCFAHTDHWRDDEQFVFASQGGETQDDPPTFEDMLDVLSNNLSEDNPVVFRFALTWVNDEGHIQIASPGGSSSTEIINLLTRAASILAFQDAQMERVAHGMLDNGLKGALGHALSGEGELPDLSAIFDNNRREKPPKQRNMVKGKVDHIKPDEMKDGYL